MKFILNNRNLKLVVDSDIIDNIKDAGIKKYPNEFGGFLIGKYSDDLSTVIITRFLLPKKYTGHPTSFERSTDGLHKLLQKLFDSKQEYYVGEWHTHPNGSTRYSSTDFNAMKAITEHKTVNIKNPVLLILSIGKSGCDDFTFYFYENGKLMPYEQN